MTKQDQDDFNKSVFDALKPRCEAASLSLVSTAIAQCGPPDPPDTYLLCGWVYQFTSGKGGQFKCKFVVKDDKFDLGGMGKELDEVVKSMIEFFYTKEVPKIITLS
jgi:hypothetical protein